MSTSITQAIADAIGAVTDNYFRQPAEKDIRSVEFRRGLAEIDVIYEQDYGWDDSYSDNTVTATIPAESILTALLQKLVEDEQCRDALSRAVAASGRND